MALLLHFLLSYLFLRNEMKQVVVRTNERRWTYFWLACFFWLLVRTFLAGVSILFDHHEWYAFDQLLSLANHQHNHQAGALFSFFSMAFYIGIVYYLFHIDLEQYDHTLFVFLEDIIANNVTDMIDSNKQNLFKIFSTTNFVTRPVTFALNCWRLLKCLFTLNYQVAGGVDIRFSGVLQSLPLLEPRYRRRMVGIQLFYEVIFKISFLVSVPILFTAYGTYIHEMSRFHYSTASMVIVVLDIALVYATSIKAFQVLVLIISFTESTTYALQAYYRQINHQLAISVRWVRPLRVRLFIDEHARVTRLILKANIRVSKLLFIALLTQLPTNCYLIAYIYYQRSAKEFESYILFILAMLQLVGFAMIILPCAYLTDRATQAKHSFLRLQYQLTVNRLRLKMRVMYTYELINTMPWIGFKVGPLTVITKSNVCSFLTMYITFMIFNANLQASL